MLVDRYIHWCTFKPFGCDMVRSKVTAYLGILGFGLLLVFEVCSSFVPALFNVAMLFAMSGGLLSMVWYILIAWRFFQLGHPR